MLLPRTSRECAGRGPVMGCIVDKLSAFLVRLVGLSASPPGDRRSSPAVPGRGEPGGEASFAASRRSLAVSFLAVAAFCALSIAVLDRPLAFACRSVAKGIRESFRFVTAFGLSGWYLVPSFLLFILFRFRYRNPAWAGRALFVFVAVALSGVLVDVLKFVLGRYRPAMMFRDGLYGFTLFQTDAGATSFPSGHAAVITALAMSLDAILPRYRAAYVVFALLVTASRVVTCAHFLSDAVAGAYVAAITVLLLKHLFTGTGLQLRHR